MKTLRLKFAVLSGAAVGLIAGTAVYGVVSTGTSTRTTPTDTVAAASLAVAPARPPLKPPVRAHCAKGATLQRGICIVHVQRVVRIEHVIHIHSAQPAMRAVSRAGSSPSGANTSQAQVHSARAPVQPTAAHQGEPAEVDSERAPTGEGGD